MARRHPLRQRDPLQFNAVCYGCSGFWRAQTSALKQTFYERTYLCPRGLGGLLGGLAPQGVCS